MAEIGVGICKAGTETCSNAGMWGPCVGAVYPAPEICDGLDNDCNGMADEGCAPLPFQNLIDYDAAGDKSLFAIGGDGNNIYGKCWKGDGTIRRDTFTVVSDKYMGSGGGNGPMVVSARASRISLVTWCSEQNGFNARVFRSMLFDPNCQPIGVPFNWMPPPSGQYDYDTAIDAQGNFVLAWEDPNSPQSSVLHVSFYDSTGAAIVPDLLAGQCDASGNGYAMHVALNQVTGAGVVSCQGHEFNVIRYRRFDANHAFIDPAMVDVAETTNNHSSWYESHAIGMNDSGELALEWEDAGNKQLRANFYSAAGALVQSVSLGPTDPTFYWDAFRYPHQAVQLDNGDFLFRDDPWSPNLTTRFWRYTSAGAFVGCGTSTHTKQSLRSGSGAGLFMAQGDTILPSALDVSNAVCP
jgi:Putative metal-binding motif